MKLIQCLVIILSVMVVASPVYAERYLSKAEFLDSVFGESNYEKRKLWLTGDLKAVAGEILKHDYHGLRISYWRGGTTTAWVLDEIGKERPITIGVAVASGKIQQVNILEFRESRGWEVRYPFFTEQFADVTLNEEKRLSKIIDGVTGATLSVRAVKKVAALALYFHSQVVNDSGA